MIVALVFDLDGTLVDTADSVMKYYGDLFAHLGAPEPKREDECRLLALSEKETILRFANVGPEALERAKEFKKNYDFTEAARLIKFNPDIKKIIGSLSEKYLMAVATNRGNSVYALLEQMEICGYFQKIFNIENIKEPKPSPWVVHEICRQFSVSPEEVAFVGDTSADVSCAARAGAVSVAVGEMWKDGEDAPDYVIKNLSELAALLDKIN